MILLLSTQARAVVVMGVKLTFNLRKGWLNAYLVFSCSINNVSFEFFFVPNLSKNLIPKKHKFLSSLLGVWGAPPH